MTAQPPPQFAPPPPAHPQSTTALILGILGLVLCQVIAPFAWVMGKKAMDEIDRNPGMYSGRGEAQAGKIMGIIGTALLAFALVAGLGFLVLIAVGVAVGSSR